MYHVEELPPLTETLTDRERRCYSSRYEVEDIFASLLEAKDPKTGEGFSLPELVSESSLLLVAGKLCTSYLLKIFRSLPCLTCALKDTIASLPQWRLLSSIYYTTPPV